MRAQSLRTVSAVPLADLGKQGIALRLDQIATRKVGDVPRAVVVTVNPHVPAVEVARTLRSLADELEGAV